MGELMDAMTIDCEKVAKTIAGFIRGKISRAPFRTAR